MMFWYCHRKLVVIEADRLMVPHSGLKFVIVYSLTILVNEVIELCQDGID